MTRTQWKLFGKKVQDKREKDGLKVQRLAILLNLHVPVLEALEAGKSGVSDWQQVRVQRWLDGKDLKETPDWRPVVSQSRWKPKTQE